MNYFTNLSDFRENAQYILDNSTIIDKDKCVILDGVLYETFEPDDDSDCIYRFFFATDDYDYIENVPENKDIIARLASIFQ